jgi:predicted helicase
MNAPRNPIRPHHPKPLAPAFLSFKPHPVRDLTSLFASITDWSGFEAAVATLPDTTQQGAAFAHVVRHYLLWEPTYRTKLADVWFDYDVPADLRRRLNLPPRDHGIDLIARTHSGKFWAIQAKYRTDTAASLTFGELSTFTSLSFTICREISFALVCTTTSRIPGILQGLANIGDLTAETWATLPPAFFASLVTSSDTATPRRPQPRPPREHQSRAIAAAVTYYANPGRTRGKLIHPCGSGKSLTAYWIAQKLAARRVLIAVPSLALVRQTLETWMTEAVADARPVDWLCVCSDDEVADMDNETLVAHVHELGIPRDTQPAALAGHLRDAQARPGLLVVLTTYQSSPVLATAARDAGTAFDFAVLDEAHKTTGKTSGHFAHLLHDENLPLPRRLFMTATERRFASNRSDDIVSMDDPALYGETIDLLTFKAAIAAAEPILCDYRLLTIGVRESEIKTLVADNRWLDLGPDGLDEVTSLALASLIALRRDTTLHGVRHTVSFHSSIARASRFRELCNRL